MANTRKYDLVIFGATGASGTIVCQYLARLLMDRTRWNECFGDNSIDNQFRWAISGRNKERLEKLWQQVLSSSHSKDTSESSIPEPELIVAEIEQIEQIRAICSQSFVVLNSTGPYRQYGETIVRCCIETGCDYCDLCSYLCEPHYIEYLLLRYDLLAQKAAVRLVLAAGYDAIPWDFGVELAKQQQQQQNLGNQQDRGLHTVEMSMHCLLNGSGYVAHNTTLISLLQNIAQSSHDGSSQLDRLLAQRYSLNAGQYPLANDKPRKRLCSLNSHKNWRLLFPNSTKSMTTQTQRYLYEHFGEQPVHIKSYFWINWMVPGVLSWFASLFTSLIPWLPLRFIRQHSHRLSMGTFREEPATLEHNLNDGCSFRLKLKSFGWIRKEELPQEETNNNDPTKVDPQEVPVKNKKSKRSLKKLSTIWISGPNPDIVASVYCLEVALSLRFERHLMPSGGVLTPVAALRRTSYLDRLQKSGHLKVEYA